MLNMNMITGCNISKEAWCDVELSNISWTSDGRDLVLTFNMHENKIGRLLCSWAHSTCINITSGKNEGGFPMTSDVNFKEIDNKGWEVHFNFAHRGDIEISCNEISLEL